ncbi:MAG TPA: nucleoside 2-deoxyribosyltransferase [Rhodopila sp.]|uniref:nucleoside 2-deoxyribosyltransferase n=1 Tax=Rhodopila sp. TaxID=2480087 RepID=UPI002C84A24B|nr:nucleoside 2-deoxyribosyltransferase [Rhodopila sp.]HVY18033.1 nucleoside 2-deoxyribosyltransferase [Rhodopila sp.]
MATPRLYLAGPTVFLPEPEPEFARMKSICRACGVEGVAPLDGQMGLEGLPPGRPLLEAIVRADMALMDSVDGAVFCLDGFRRGPEMDTGTAFEVGYMKALRKPIAGWTRDPRPYPDRVSSFFRDVFGLELAAAAAGATGGTSGLTRDPDGWLVHSEGCIQNAMVHVGIELSGGLVAAAQDWEDAFAAAVRSVAVLLGVGA